MVPAVHEVAVVTVVAVVSVVTAVAVVLARRKALWACRVYGIQP